MQDICLDILLIPKMFMTADWFSDSSRLAYQRLEAE